MTRARKNTRQVCIHLNAQVFEDLAQYNPQIMTRDSVSLEPKFRHGALSRYVERLIRQDLDERKLKGVAHVPSIQEILNPSFSGKINPTSSKD